MPPTESPWKLLGLAVAWLFLAVVVLIGGGVVVVFAAHIWDARSGRWEFPPLNSGGTTIIAVLGLLAQGVMVLASLRRARRIGGGDLIAGLGTGPVRRPWLLATLAVLLLAVSYAWIIGIHALWPHLPHVGGIPLTPAQSGSLLATTLMGLLVCVGAPVSEELFFRGWLWAGLRQSWGLWPAACITAVFWLLTHLGDGSGKPLYIVPAAVILSVARHRCGSVWASMGLHALNNSVVVGLALWGWASAPH